MSRASRKLQRHAEKGRKRAKHVRNKGKPKDYVAPEDVPTVLRHVMHGALKFVVQNRYIGVVIERDE